MGKLLRERGARHNLLFYRKNDEPGPPEGTLFCHSDPRSGEESAVCRLVGPRDFGVTAGTTRIDEIVVVFVTIFYAGKRLREPNIRPARGRHESRQVERQQIPLRLRGSE